MCKEVERRGVDAGLGATDAASPDEARPAQIVLRNRNPIAIRGCAADVIEQGQTERTRGGCRDALSRGARHGKVKNDRANGSGGITRSIIPARREEVVGHVDKLDLQVGRLPLDRRSKHRPQDQNGDDTPCSIFHD